MNKNELKELYPKMSEQFMETVNTRDLKTTER